jgi:squalene-hopene/tetraprenyl-beta-curcumene cyclase
VPDADDTAGALLALRHLGPIDDEVRQSARKGIRWLLGLRNSDGGMPTFCRGWGKLPFDRSGADLTAHALSAWQVWLPDIDEPRLAIANAQSFLARAQDADGSWCPLWFGNEHAPGEENRTYGTARVVMALAGSRHPMLEAALQWLRSAQNQDGGWGGGRGSRSSLEETALAVHALAEAGTVDSSLPSRDRQGAVDSTIDRGVAWLIEATQEGTRVTASPIGLYFARLWYFEELYPLIFAIGALLRARNAIRRRRANS